MAESGTRNGSRVQAGRRVELTPELRRRVLAEEPFCPGYPAGVHGAPCENPGSPQHFGFVHGAQLPPHGARHVRTTVVDHLRGRALDGTNDRANLGGKCAACNSRKSIEREGARRGPEGWRRR